jgi:hypothetical protein
MFRPTIRGRLRTAGFALSGIFAAWSSGFVFGLIAGAVWFGDRDDGLLPHELGLAGLGLKLAVPHRALPSVELLLAEHHCG